MLPFLYQKQKGNHYEEENTQNFTHRFIMFLCGTAPGSFSFYAFWRFRHRRKRRSERVRKQNSQWFMLLFREVMQARQVLGNMTLYGIETPPHSKHQVLGESLADKVRSEATSIK